MKELLYALPGGNQTDWVRWGFTPAHMTYRLVPGPKLIGVGLTGEVRGGAMYVASSGEELSGDPLPCCRQVVGECRKRGFSRVVCDFEGAPVGALAALTAELVRACSQNGLTFYLPEPFAPLAEGCRVLVSSALVTGTLEKKLRDAMARYGPERVVLAVEAVAEDFLLPASGRGAPLTQSQLAALTARLEPAVFFDRGMCAHYFTYMNRGEGAHFILFDTPRSVQEKLDTAQRLGVTSALLAAPQVEGWLEEIFGGEV